MLSSADDGDTKQSGSGGGFESEGKSSAAGYPSHRETRRSEVYEEQMGQQKPCGYRGD